MYARVDSRELALVLEQLGSTARQRVSRVLPAVAEALVSAVSDVYDAEGPGWEPLKEGTLRGRRGSSSRILQDTGVMAGSTHGVTGNDWAEAAAGVDYANFHATGTGRMARRDPFDLGKNESRVLEDIAQMVATEVSR